MTNQLLARPTKTFEDFKRTLEREFFRHPVIVHNAYTKWIKQGTANEEQVRDLLMQFSVFSNHFIVLQAKRMVNAETEEGERMARMILVSECGVGMDGHTGSTEGRTFSTGNAHLNWLRAVGEPLGIDRRQMGRWDVGTRHTHAFLNGLDRTYGSRDGNVGAGASFAIENWAAFGIGGPLEGENFWKELIVGLEAFNERRKAANQTPLPLAFFTYHFQLESGHGANVWREAEDLFHEPGFDAERFLQGGRDALAAIHTFWLGLDATRKKLDDARP